MNILFLLKTYDLGGVEVVSTVLARKFMNSGHKVIVFAFEKGKGTALSYFNNIETITGYGYADNKKNINCLRSLLLDNKIQVVINQWGLPYLPIKILKRASKGLDIKIISTHHNDPKANGLLKNVEIDIENSKSIFFKSILKIKWKLINYITSHSMQYVYKHSNKFLVLSNSYIKNFISFTGIDKPNKLLVQTNPLTIENNDFTFDETQKAKEILYVGRIDYNQKRVYRIIDTWNLLETKFPDWKLTIIGDGPEYKNIQNQIKDYNLQRVSLEGFQKPEEYYKRASILLLTSEFEGFPLVLAESMSFGVIPAVYGSYSAVYDIIEDKKDGIICDYNPKGYPTHTMADRLSKIMTDDKLRYKMELNAIKKSENYSIDNIYQSWEQIFNSFT